MSSCCETSYLFNWSERIVQLPIFCLCFSLDFTAAIFLMKPCRWIYFVAYVWKVYAMQELGMTLFLLHTLLNLPLQKNIVSAMIFSVLYVNISLTKQRLLYYFWYHLGTLYADQGIDQTWHLKSKQCLNVDFWHTMMIDMLQAKKPNCISVQVVFLYHFLFLEKLPFTHLRLIYESGWTT